METILLVDLNWRSCFNVKIFDTKISREVLVYNFQQLIIHSKLLITLLTNPAISACKERQIKFNKNLFVLSTKQLAIEQNHPHQIVEELTENMK